MNHKVIMTQLYRLLDHLTQQVAAAGNPRISRMTFERKLFAHQYPTLADYLQVCHNTLASLEHEQPSAARHAWQLGRLLEQCQAIQKALHTLPPAKKISLSRQEELAGYERRLMAMVADLEAQVANATGFQEQQQLLSTLDRTRQRLQRCQTAQKDYSWKKIVT